MSPLPKPQRIASLPSTLQGIALSLKPGERVAIITNPHAHRGEEEPSHEDIYVMTKPGNPTYVFLEKIHTDDTSPWDKLERKTINSPMPDRLFELWDTTQPQQGGC